MINWEEVETVLLDMDGTLLDLHFDNFFWQRYLPAKYAESLGLPVDKAAEMLFARFADKQGTLEWYCLDYWSQELQLDIPALKLEIRHLIQVRPEVESFLAFLRRQQKQVVLVTNAHPQSLALKMDQTGIRGHFDQLISSHESGYPKEHPEFWFWLHRRLVLDPTRTLFIDDTLGILAAARRSGITRVLGIAQPDSQQPPREAVGGFPLLSSFSSLVAD